MARLAYIMQATYSPWLGYFHGIASSSCYVAFDSVAFQPKSFHQKNRVKGPQGEVWLTVPCHGSQNTLLKDVTVDRQQPWAQKHWRTLVQCYRKAAYYDYLLPFQAIYDDPPYMLVDLNLAIIGQVMRLLGITTPVVRSSQLGLLTAGKEAHIIDVLRAVDADTLLDAAGARPILDPKPFQDAGVTVLFQQYAHPTYRQQYGDFLPYMSILDLLANEGPNSLEILMAGGSWQD